MLTFHHMHLLTPSIQAYSQRAAVYESLFSYLECFFQLFTCLVVYLVIGKISLMVIKYISNQNRNEKRTGNWWFPKDSLSSSRTSVRKFVSSFHFELGANSNLYCLLYNHYLLPAARWFVCGGYCRGAGHV